MSTTGPGAGCCWGRPPLEDVLAVLRFVDRWRVDVWFGIELGLALLLTCFCEEDEVVVPLP